MTMLKWLKEHVWLVLLGLGAALTWIVFRPKPNAAHTRAIINKFQLERRVLDERATVRKLQAEKGLEQAVAKVKERHAGELKRLDLEQAEKVRDLEKDPEALSDFLLRTLG